MSARTPQAWVEGIALWAPRLPGWDVASEVLAGRRAAPEAPAPRPTPSLLPPNERRRAPDSVAVSLEVASRACAHAGVDPATLPSVFASTHGDLAITDYMCQTLASSPSLLSPTRFHNSVHNAAAGYWTIAIGCMAPYTALSAHEHSFAGGLLEALTQAQADGQPVLYVAYDIEARGPLAAMAPSRYPLGAALVLSPSRTPRSRALLHWRLRPAPAPRDPQPRDANRTLVEGNAMARCLPLFEALALGHGEIGYPVGPQVELALGIQVLAGATLDEALHG